MNVSFQDVLKAQQRLVSHTHITPIVSSEYLNAQLGHKVLFKAECLQKTGAFKARGACNAVAQLMAGSKIAGSTKPELIVANSSGNHAQAIAWSASKFGLASKIFMPANASSVKAAATTAYGAEIVYTDTRAQADALVAAAAEQAGVHWVPPYNHVDVIAGQGTAAAEALQEISDVDAVFAPCGGGGLLSGTLISSRALCPAAKVIGAEPLAGNDAVRSLAANAIQRLSETPNTLADGARTLAVGDISFKYLQQLDDLLEVSEDAIRYWCQWLNHVLKLRIEPTSALAMDGVCQWLQRQTTPKTVLVILSGGNMDRATEQAVWETDYLTIQPSLTPLA